MDIKYSILVAFLIMFISGCSGISLGKSPAQVAAIPDTSHLGYQGVVLSFVSNNPPSIIFTGSPLNIVVQLSNQGAVPVSGGTLYLSGYDTNLFPITPRQQQFNLDAKTKFNTVGGLGTVTFTSPAIYLPAGTDVLQQTFLASACYTYTTQVRVPVCVNPNPTSFVANQACTVVNPPVTGGQGGPVSVTAITENAEPGKVGFLITVANQGGGVVVNPNADSMNRCPSPLNYGDTDIVQYSNVVLGTISAGSVDCQPTGNIMIGTTKQGTLYCTFTLSDSTSPAYQTILSIDLTYGYLTHTSAQVTIKSLT